MFYVDVMCIAGVRPARKEDLTQPLLSHTHSVAASVRPTLGCVLIYGVTDIFVVHDGLP